MGCITPVTGSGARSHMSSHASGLSMPGSLILGFPTAPAEPVLPCFPFFAYTTRHGGSLSGSAPAVPVPTTNLEELSFVSAEPVPMTILQELSFAPAGPVPTTSLKSYRSYRRNQYQRRACKNYRLHRQDQYQRRACFGREKQHPRQASLSELVDSESLVAGRSTSSVSRARHRHSLAARTASHDQACTADPL